LNEVAVVIPETIENLQLPAPELITYYKNLNERTIWIDSEIDVGVLEVSKKILEWNRDDRGVNPELRVPIRILIFSPGGELASALNLINIIQLSKTPVYTYNMGDASSAGLYILLAGHKRYSIKDATAVLHKGSGYMGGTASQLDASAKWYKQQLDRLRDYVLKRTSLDSRTYKRRQDDDWYLSTDELINYRFIDEIVEDITAIIG